MELLPSAMKTIKKDRAILADHSTPTSDSTDVVANGNQVSRTLLKGSQHQAEGSLFYDLDDVPPWYIMLVYTIQVWAVLLWNRPSN